MEIILARGTAPLSKLIVYLTGGRFSHTAIRYGGADSDWIVHAFISGVVPEWHSYFVTKYKELKRFQIIKNIGDAENALDNIVLKYRHKKYDYAGLFGHLIVVLFSKFGIKINPPFGSRNAFLCTELIAEFIKEYSALSGLKIPDMTQFSTPKDIEELMLSRNDIFREKKELL
jgi:hypothetical protein